MYRAVGTPAALGPREDQVICLSRRIRILSFIGQDIGHHGNLLVPPT